MTFDRYFGGGLQLGAITADQFSLGTVARDSSDRFIYNRSSGALPKLQYDSCVGFKTCNADLPSNTLASLCSVLEVLLSAPL